MERKHSGEATATSTKHSESEDAEIRNRELKAHTEWLIHEIMQSPIAKARLADPIKRK